MGVAFIVVAGIFFQERVNELQLYRQGTLLMI